MNFKPLGFRVPAKAAPEAVARVVRQFSNERSAGETFQGWLKRTGGATVLAGNLRDLDIVPTPDAAPEFFVDYDETGPFVAAAGESECAT